MRADSHWRSWRGILAAITVLGVAVLSAGCGGSGSDSQTSASDPSDPGSVTVEHHYGTTEVPIRPERIVSLDVQWTDVLAALDAPPVGYLLDPNLDDGNFPWRGDLLEDATGLTATDALPYEQIAALEPDLIVVTYLAPEQADYEQLSAIAPTIAALSDNQVDSWQDIARAAGTVLGTEEDADALIERVEAGVAAVAEELPNLEGKTFALVSYVPGDAFYVVSDPDDGAIVLFAQLGLEISPTILAAGDDVSGRVELSLEQASLLDADVLVLLTNGADPEEIIGYDQLPAVQSGAVALLDYAEVSGLNTPTPLSVPYSLDVIRAALEAAAT